MQLLRKLDGTASTKALTHSEIVELALSKKISKASTENLLTKIGITAAEKGQVAVKHQVTLSTLNQAIMSDKLSEAEAKQIATILGLNTVETANIGITNILTACFTKLWTVITSHPIGAILTAIGAVAIGVTAYINKANEGMRKKH